MKKIIPFLALLVTATIVFHSCKKASTAYIDETFITDTTAVLKYSGNFVSGPYGTVTGVAKVYLREGRYTVALENFNSSNGPDLKVYIAKEQPPVNFIKLNDLRSVSGNQLYDVPGSPDFTVYKYVLIHCEQYNHLFGIAEIR